MCAARRRLAVMGWSPAPWPGPAVDPGAESQRLQDQLRQLETCRQNVADARATLDRLAGEEWRGPAAAACARRVSATGLHLRRAEHDLEAAMVRCRHLLWTVT